MARIVFVLFCCSSFGGSPLSGAVYHVNQNDPAASDSGAGTTEQPWKTISKAATALQPGDTAIVHAGVYREHVRPARSGQPGQPIAYRAAEGEDVVISGADVITGWTKAKGNVWKKEEWPYRFPTHPNDERHRLIGRCEQVIVDGCLLTPAETVTDMQPGGFCALPEQKTLYIRLTDDTDPNHCQVEASVRPVCFGLGWGREPRHHIHLRGITIRHAANTAQRGALYAVGDNWLIEDCLIEWTNGNGFSFRGDDITIRRVRSHHNGQQGASGGGRRFLLDEVVLDHNNLKGYDTDWEAGAIKITHARDGVVRRCRAESNDGNGFWFDIDVRDVVVEECVAKDNAGHGIYVEISGGFRIRNNLCVRNGLDGKWGRGGISVAESDHCTIEHNTCALNPTGISIREQGPRTFPGIDGRRVSYHVHDITIRRNICAVNSKYQIGLWWDNSFFGPHPSPGSDARREPYDPDLASIVIDYNVYWFTDGQRLALWGVPWRRNHKQYRKLDTWQAQRGQDAHSLVANPQFVDPDGNDWNIRADSPATSLKAGRQ